MFSATIALRDLLPRAGRNPASKSSRRRYARALTLLAVTGVVFRSEVAVLLGCHTVYLFLHPGIRLSLRSVVPAGLIGTISGLVLTVPIDSFFWQKWPLWPELTGFIYNVIDKQSSSWGTQSWHFYLSSALPRLLFNPVIYQICIPFTLSLSILRRSALDILIPNVLFLIIYSFQPHKEWRFIIYIVPSFLAVASAGASWIWTRRTKSFVYRVLALALVASTIASFTASFAMLAVSSLNYPGADALNRLHFLANNDTGVVQVHMDTLACMTGVTHFVESPATVLGDQDAALWIYDKTEDEQKLLDPIFWERFDYALAESPERVIGQWEIWETVQGYAGLTIVRPEEDTKHIPVDFDPLTHLWRRHISFETSKRELKHFWDQLANGGFETLMRKHVTRGWWVKIKTEPKIHILKKESGSLLANEQVDDLESITESDAL